MHTDDKNENYTLGISLDDISFMQLSDSFFPTGLYTTSNGLECLFYDRHKDKNKKLSSNDISNFVKAYLCQQIGPTDCCIIGNVYDCINKNDSLRLMDLDNVYYCMRLIEETRSASTRSGIQLIRCVSSFVKDGNIDFYLKSIAEKKAKGVYPVSFGLACNAMHIPKEKAGLMLTYGFTVSIIGAALRLGVLQHYEGQKIIHNLKPTILSAVVENIDRGVSDMWQFLPHLDILQMHHEQMDSKMFIT
jgi:urease accessory protein